MDSIPLIFLGITFTLAVHHTLRRHGKTYPHPSPTNMGSVMVWDKSGDVLSKAINGKYYGDAALPVPQVNFGLKSKQQIESACHTYK